MGYGSRVLTGRHKGRIGRHVRSYRADVGPERSQPDVGTEDEYLDPADAILAGRPAGARDRQPEQHLPGAGNRQRRGSYVAPPDGNSDVGGRVLTGWHD